MKTLRLACALALMAALGACAYPVSTTDQGAAASGLYFPGAPAGARVLVDGADAGETSLYDGRKLVLTLPAGQHRIVVQQGSTRLYDKPVYLGTGSRIAIKVP